MTTVLATAAFALPFIVLGDVAGLEIMRPMAIFVLGGLVSAGLLILFVFPSIYLLSGPSPASETETSVERTTGLRADGGMRSDRDDTTSLVPDRRSRSPRWRSGACNGGTTTSAPKVEAITIAEDEATGREDPDPVREGRRAAGRRDRAGRPGPARQMPIPYAAVVYDADGKTWTYVNAEPLVVRARRDHGRRDRRRRRSPVRRARRPGTLVVTHGCGRAVRRRDRRRRRSLIPA